MTRVSEHNNGVYPKAYTARRRPVELMWSESFIRAEDAVKLERKIKGWSRRKKEALIRGDWDAISKLGKRR